jgi:DNA-binding MarR family transcriptional regulator
MSKMYWVPDNQSSRIHGPRDSTGTLYLVKRLEQLIRQRLDESLKALDLTALQYTALTVLRARPGLSSAELARASFVTAQSMNEMVLALEKKGLMTRVPSDTDRRVLRLKLTPSAATVVAGADEIVDRLEAQLLGGIADETRDTFRSALYQGLKALADEATPASPPAAVPGTEAPRRARAARPTAAAPPRSRSPRRGR